MSFKASSMSVRKRSLQTCEHSREQRLASEMASLGLRNQNKVVLELTFVFRESVALILLRVLKHLFLRGHKASSCPFSLSCGERIPNPRLQVRKLNVWFEIAKTHKQVLNLSPPHTLLNLMLRMKRVLSSFKKTIRLSTIFHHLETKQENLEDPLEIVLSSALVLKVWNLKPRDSSK